MTVRPSYVVLALPWLSVLAGCFGFGAATMPTVHSYHLSYAPPPAETTTVPLVLQVMPLRIAAAYDSESIAYREGDHGAGTYFYHRWAAHPAKLVTDLLARDIAHSHRYRAVALGASMLPIDIVLNGDIEEIGEVATDDGCAARLRMRVVVARLSSRSDPILLQSTYAHDEPCPCRDPAALVPAMSRAMQRLSQQIESDMLAAIESASPPPSK